MKAEYINPFLEAATNVIEQLVQVKPSAGPLAVKDIKFVENYTWIQIGLNGQMQGDIVFGLSDKVALQIVSAMMGGYALSEIDEMVQSAISELGNMISGNASTLLYNKGVHVDITPPTIMQSALTAGIDAQRALTIPLIIEGIGNLDIQVVVMS